MKVFAISDLHLSLNGGELRKPMDRFGEAWVGHHKNIAEDWGRRVDPADLVIVAGDLSWASGLPVVKEDLQWLHQLPGRKVLVKGNHDWWVPKTNVRAKLASIMPSSIHVLHNDAVVIEDTLLFGTRLWVIPGLDFPVDWSAGESEAASAGDGTILQKEMERLRRSIAAAEQLAAQHPVTMRICVTHFPPTDFRKTSTEVTRLLSASRTDACVFGHIHNLEPGANGFIMEGVRYYLTSCDYIGFRLLEIPV
mgnify:CR=1 FL=1